MERLFIHIENQTVLWNLIQRSSRWNEFSRVLQQRPEDWFRKCIEKPKDEADAIRMLKSLSGKAHSVISAVSLFGLKAEYYFSDETLVYFEEMNDLEIEFYVKNFKPYDKAGSYAIQEWIGMNKISKIEGSYYNVMGLPAHLLYKYLEEYKKI